MKKTDELKENIFNLVKEYHVESFTKNTKGEHKKVSYAGRVFNEKELQNLIDASLRFYLTSDRYIPLFEKKLSSILNIKYSLFTCSGSASNLLAFMALTQHELGSRRIKRGDEVITTACCFPTTLAPIIQYGAIPVFVDCDLSGNINVAQIEDAITTKTKVIVYANTLGNPVDLKSIYTLCKKYNLWQINDCCDALGSTYNKIAVERYGDISTSSFYPAHMITVGEGGMVHTENKELYNIVKSLRDWGRDYKCQDCIGTCDKRFANGYDCRYTYSHFGYNLKNTELAASIGVAQLEKLPDFIKKRKENFNFLYRELKDLYKYFILPEATENSDPCWFSFLIIVRPENIFTRNDLVQFLEAHDIQTRPLFAGNILKQKCFQYLKENEDYRISGDLFYTALMMNSAFFVGVYPGLNEEHMKYIANTIKEFVGIKNGLS